MSEERKAKAAARRAARKQRNSASVEHKPIDVVKPELDIDYTVDKPNELNYDWVKDGKTPNEVAYTLTGTTENTPDTVANVENIAAGTPVVNTPSVATAEKPITIADLLANQRMSLKNEKTESAKMQKYYALTDALKALGQMGGTAIGGAIGGNVLDSAPSVTEYKPSRGYLDAIEKTKKANEKLRALDEKEYNLAVRDEDRAYKKQLIEDERDYKDKVKAEERAYNDKVRAEDRAWKEAQSELDRKQKAEAARVDAEWHFKLAQLKNELEKASREDAAKIKKEIAEEDRKWKREQMKLKLAYEIKRMQAKEFFIENENISDEQLREFLRALDEEDVEALTKKSPVVKKEDYVTAPAPQNDWKWNGGTFGGWGETRQEPPVQTQKKSIADFKA